MEFEFSGEIFYWRGPSPFYYIAVPEQRCAEIKVISAEVTYGWGMIPATITIGQTEWTTSLFPKDGRYLIPIKKVIRTAEEIDDGDTVSVVVTIDF